MGPTLLHFSRLCWAVWPPGQRCRTPIRTVLARTPGAARRRSAWRRLRERGSRAIATVCGAAVVRWPHLDPRRGDRHTGAGARRVTRVPAARMIYPVRMRRIGPLVLLLALGCHTQPVADPPAGAPAAPEIVAPAAEPESAPTGPAATGPAATPAATGPAATGPAATEPAATGPAPTEPAASEPVVAAAGPAVAPPAAPLEPIATWPFHRWDRAEAIRFNHVPYGPGIPLRAYDAANGWSPKIRGRTPISQEQAAQAVKWTIATGGEVEVSSCPFPRHAIVFLSGETPVGSVNVCFDCGDILVWPDIDRAPDQNIASDAELRRYEQRYKKKLAAYKKIFPRWEKLFRDELGWKLHPTRPDKPGTK
jgi:hypothetical protein